MFTLDTTRLDEFAAGLRSMMRNPHGALPLKYTVLSDDEDDDGGDVDDNSEDGCGDNVCTTIFFIVIKSFYFI